MERFAELARKFISAIRRILTSSVGEKPASLVSHGLGVLAVVMLMLILGIGSVIEAPFALFALASTLLYGGRNSRKPLRLLVAILPGEIAVDVVANLEEVQELERVELGEAAAQRRYSRAIVRITTGFWVSKIEKIFRRVARSVINLGR